MCVSGCGLWIHGENSQRILDDISLFAKPGQKIAFVGSTGAGESTIINLVNRFYEIQSERSPTMALISGRSAKMIFAAELLHGHSGYASVYRDHHGKHRYGRLDATDEEVHDATRSWPAQILLSAVCLWGMIPCSMRTEAIFPRTASGTSHAPKPVSSRY